MIKIITITKTNTMTITGLLLNQESMMNNQRIIIILRIIIITTTITGFRSNLESIILLLF